MAAAAAGAGSRAAAAGEAADSASPAGCRKAPCCWRCSKLSSPPWSPAAGRVGGGGGGGARRHHQRRAARGEEGAAAPPRPRSSGAAAASACIPPRALEGRLSRDCLRPRRPACSQRSRSYLAPERTLEKEPVSLGPEHPAEDCGQAKEEGLLSVFGRRQSFTTFQATISDRSTAAEACTGEPFRLGLPSSPPAFRLCYTKGSPWRSGLDLTDDWLSARLLSSVASSCAYYD